MTGKKTAARKNVSRMRQLTKEVKSLNGKIHGPAGKGSGGRPKSAKT